MKLPLKKRRPRLSVQTNGEAFQKSNSTILQLPTTPKQPEWEFEVSLFITEFEKATANLRRGGRSGTL